MEVYRLSSEKYAHELRASGAANRWNRENQYVIYAASSRSLATLEMVAHRNAIMGGIRYRMMRIHVPDKKGILKKRPLSSLPEKWQALKNYAVTQHIGSQWYSTQESLVLRIPSAIIPQEFNYSINTRHANFSEIELLETEDFDWDRRLL